jgi:hypothetical protein
MAQTPQEVNPRTPHILGMNDQSSRGDRYALSALRKRRALLAAEIIQLERQVRARKDSLVHVDATLKLLDPDYDSDTIRPKRIPQRIQLFRQGELGRLILGALRDGGGVLTTQEIVAAVLRAGGHGEGARKAMGQRVRANLAYLERRRKIGKSGGGPGARWSLIE